MSRPSKVTGNPAIDAVMATLNKNKVLVSPRPVVKLVPPISTGSLGLDLALKIGGLPQGRIIEINGDEASSKTSLCLYWAKQAQDLFPDKFILIADMEYSLTEDYILSFGLDLDRIIYAQADTVAEIFQAVMDLTKTGQFSFVIFDSIDACQTQTQLDKDIGEADVGGISKIASRFFREYSKVCSKTNTTAVFINQIKYNPSPFAKNGGRTTPGGTALKFYASVRFESAQIKPSPKNPNAYIVSLKILKNKLGPKPKDAIEFEFIYGKGPDPAMDILNVARDLGVLSWGGSKLKFNFNGAIEVLTTDGKDGWAEVCQTSPDIVKKVREACIAMKKSGNELEIAPDNEDEENPPAEVIAELTGDIT